MTANDLLVLLAVKRGDYRATAFQLDSSTNSVLGALYRSDLIRMCSVDHNGAPIPNHHGQGYMLTEKAHQLIDLCLAIFNVLVIK